MGAGAMILFGFSTSHPKGLGEFRGHMTTTRVRFLDYTGAFVNIIERIAETEKARKNAFVRWTSSTGLEQSFWAFLERRYGETGERLLNQAQRKLQSFFRRRAMRMISPTTLSVEVTSFSSNSFQPLQHSFEMNDLADDLDAAKHLWFSLQSVGPSA